MDLKSVPWIKLSADATKDQSLFGLTPGQKWAWVCILCEAAKQNSDGKAKINTEFLEFSSGVAHDDIDGLFQHLETIGLIKVTCTTNTRPLRARAQKKSYSDKSVSKGKEKVTEGKGKGKEKGIEKHVTDVTDLSDQEIELARSWLDLAIKEFPHKADSPKWTVERFGQDIRKARASVKMTHEQMALLFDFVKHSAFWRPNAATPSGLLKTGNNGLTKIDNIIASMKPVERRESEIFNEQIASGQFKKSTEQIDENALKRLGLL